ncbi:hypothetical protein E2C01_084980 [Portunus trituberculatus]|uniref:Uncharacterized protein n=1 Tax=Portunus trituberculatus TaxID=210409 RepID=A0A5B7J678_PORTR|nr:hypothetical protein [Portunus trituberculatus]
MVPLFCLRNAQLTSANFQHYPYAIKITAYQFREVRLGWRRGREADEVEEVER